MSINETVDKDKFGRTSQKSDSIVSGNGYIPSIENSDTDSDDNRQPTRKSRFKLEKRFNLISNVHNCPVPLEKFNKKAPIDVLGDFESADDQIRQNAIYANLLKDNYRLIKARLSSVRDYIHFLEKVEDILQDRRNQDKFSSVIIVKSLALVAHQIPNTREFQALLQFRKLVLLMCQTFLLNCDKERAPKYITQANSIGNISQSKILDEPFLNRAYGNFLKCLTSGNHQLRVPSINECTKENITIHQLITKLIEPIHNEATTCPSLYARYKTPEGKNLHFIHAEGTRPSTVLTLEINMIEEALNDSSPVISALSKHVLRKTQSEKFRKQKRSSIITVDEMQSNRNQLLNNRINRGTIDIIDAICSRCCGKIVHAKIL